MPEWRLRRYNVLAQKTATAPLRASLCRGTALQVLSTDPAPSRKATNLKSRAVLAVKSSIEVRRPRLICGLGTFMLWRADTPEHARTL